MKRYVLGFMFNQTTQFVALMEKERPEWQRGQWNGLGGHIEEGETPVEAMRREFREESGVDYPEWELFAVLEGDHHGRYEMFVFRAITDRFFEIKWGKMDEGFVGSRRVGVLPAKALPNVHWLIAMALHSEATSGMPYSIKEGPCG